MYGVVSVRGGEISGRWTSNYYGGYWWAWWARSERPLLCRPPVHRGLWSSLSFQHHHSPAVPLPTWTFSTSNLSWGMWAPCEESIA